MHSATIRFVLISVSIVASHAAFAANGGFPSTVPIPAHELNFSPAFGGYSGNLTLLATPVSTQQRTSVTARPQLVGNGNLWPGTSTTSPSAEEKNRERLSSIINADNLTDARNTAESEVAEAERKLAIAEAKLKQLEEERGAALSKKKKLDNELLSLPALTPIKNSAPVDAEPSKPAAPAPAPKP